MADPYIGEIKMFAGNFAPRNYSFCNGQLLPIQQNTALFSILGVTYGGDGKATFALPNLQGRVPMFWGNGPGLSQHYIGEMSGEASVTLLTSEMPAHSHSLNCNENGDGGSNPQSAAFTGEERGGENVYASQTPSVQMSPQGVGNIGDSQAHNNMQPYLGLNFIIALAGMFPPRS